MRIEMVVPGLPTAGMEMVVARLMRQLAARGHEVAVSCTEYIGRVGETLAAEGFDVALTPLPGRITNLYPRNLEDRLRSVRPDVVHIHSGVWLKAARAAARANIGRVVHTEHGIHEDPHWYDPYLFRFAARYTHVVTAVSRSVGRFLSQTVGIDPAKIVVLPNGIDTEQFAPGLDASLIRQRFGLSPQRILIGHIGRFAPVKNHALLLTAFAEVRRCNPDAFLVLIGDGPLRDEILTRISELGLQDSVGLYGVTDGTAQLYRELDIFVLPSSLEGTSMSILEAMASALPIVATAVGGTPDLVGDAGVLVPSNDATPLSAALVRLAADPGERRRLGAEARQRAMTHFDESRIVDRYLEIYAAEPVLAGVR